MMDNVNNTPNDLQESFLLDAWDALSTFESATQELKAGEQEGTIKSLAVVSHRLKGTAALYGYPQVSKLAEMVEQLLENGHEIAEADSERLLGFLEQVTVCLQGALGRISGGEEEGDLGLELVELGGSRLLMELVKAHPALFIRKAGQGQKEQIAQEAAKVTLTQELRRFRVQNGDVWEFFPLEVEEHVELVRDTLGKEIDEESITVLFRAMHTLKGAAYMVGLNPFGDLAHKLEDLMMGVREADKPFDEPTVQALSDGTDTLEKMIQTAEGREVGLEDSLLDVRRRLAELLGEEMPQEEVEEEGLESADVASENLGEEVQPEEVMPVATLTADLRAFYAANAADIWEYFKPEVEEHLDAMQDTLAEVNPEAGELSDEQMAQLFRSAHTIKGSSYTVDLQPLGDLGHLVEDLMAEVRETELPFDREVHEALLEGTRVMAMMLSAAEGDETELETRLPELQTRLASLLGIALPTAEAAQPSAVQQAVQEVAPVRSAPKSVRTIRVGLDKLDTLMNLAGETVAQRSRLGLQLGQLGEIRQLLALSQGRMTRTINDFEEQYLNPRLAAQSAEKLRQQSGQKQATQAPKTNAPVQEMFDELEFDTYNDLNILARSIAEMSNDLDEIQGQLSNIVEGFEDETENLQKISRALRSEVSRARMVPVGQLFSRLSRLVQSSADKAYRMKTSGESAEIDNAILEEITDPMLHLVKNAIAHGVEPREVREKQGKEPEGTVSLRAYLQGNSIVIDVEDDGAGVNADSLRRKAVEKGFRKQDDVDAMNDQEALQLMFIPGLSTAESVTTEAGRGVGMDAVATNIQRLKGEIQVFTKPGQGTRFSLKLPLTLLVSEALTVRVSGQAYAFSLNTVRELRTISRERANEGSVAFEGQAVPIYNLADLLGLPSAETDTVSLVILEAAGERLALIVDAFDEIDEVVIKPLGDTLAKLYYLSGATVSSTNEVVLLLEPTGLTRLAKEANQPAEVRAQTPVFTPKSVQRVLLADDSVSVRRVVGKMLERAGYDVTTAVDGQDAFDIVMRGETFDAILTDLEMPRMNGYELIEAVRRRSETETTPICVMTTRAGAKHMDLAFALGANEYLSKPVDESKLLGYLEQTL